MSRPNPKEIKSPERCIELGKNFLSRARVGEISETEGYETALSYFERALELDSQNAKAWYGKGEVLGDHFFSGRWEEALQCYKQAILHGKKKKEDWFLATVWTRMGELLGMLDRREEGLTALDQASKHAKSVKMNVIWYSLFCALVELGAPSKNVQKCLNMAKGRYDPGGENYFGQMAEAYNRDVAYRKHFLEGIAWVKRKNDEEAIKAFDQAISFFGSIIRRGFDAKLGKGQSLIRLGKLDEAARMLRVLTEYYPYYSEAWSNYALVLTFQGKIEEALHCVKQAYQLNPSDSVIELVKNGVRMMLESKGIKMAEDFWDFLEKSTSSAS